MTEDDDDKVTGNIDNQTPLFSPGDEGQAAEPRNHGTMTKAKLRNHGTNKDNQVPLLLPGDEGQAAEPRSKVQTRNKACAKNNVRVTTKT